jgi:Protein of unknown function with PCYCGC motif
MTDRVGRRDFILALSGLALALTGFPEPLTATVCPGQGPHPKPRPGIDASRVLSASRIEHKEAAPVYELVREIPQVVDGIRCYCGCAETPGNYSLLSCYEANGMAQHCLVCQGEARLVHRLHRNGWSLNGIRTAVDAQFGGS